MKQKIFSLLVLLVVAVTGAWAQFSTASGEVSSKINTKKALKAPIRRTGYGDAYNLRYAVKRGGIDNAYLQYSTEEYVDCVGTGGGAVYWGIRFPAADLAAYAGQILTQVGVFTDSDGDNGYTYSGNYTVRVYQGGDTAPGTLVSEATEYLPGDFAWHDITLTTPVEIDATQDLWLTFYTPDIAYPMSGCTYTGNPDSNFLSLDGNTWAHSSDYGIDRTWMIRGVAAPASTYALEVEDSEHGTVQFNIGEDEDLEEDVSSAEEGDKVTVIVTPEDGYMVAEVTGEWQAAIARAPHRAAVDMMRDIDLQFVSEDATTRAKTYTFEMIRANAEFSCTYKKLLTHPDITVEPIADIPYTSVPIEPEVVVKDGETTLVLGTDYTVTYVNNVEIGTATVIITAVASSNYSGSIQTTFEIITNRLVLETSIANAWNYYNSIKDTNPDVAAWLKEAIDAAQEVLDNEDASQRELGDAANVLNDAVIAAQTEVDAKRITITIPAKSYVARIDAVKRTIDEGVAGVSLYSVKSVTDSEVELTAELGIVPEETPYIIYNNNDEDVTISIVFTHDAPDDVTYDSEHFKGTLTDKAITDEDLQAADYYTLTEGLDFTKMQAAATVAANQCWIELAPASDAHASSLTIVPEGGTTPTGIADVQREATNNNVYYDLNGRRVAQPTKGLYILNGKKVLVK